MDKDKCEEVLRQLRRSLVNDFQPAETSVRDFHALVRACKRCRDIPVNPTLPLGQLANPKALLVTDTPLDGFSPSYDLIMSAIKHSAWGDDDIVITSAVRCEKANSSEHFTNCSSWLFSEINFYSPDIVVAMGTRSVSVLLGGAEVRLGDVVGSERWLGPHRLYFLYSPIYALKASKEEEFKSHVDAASRL